ncbi:unnamed protein product [Polarella glacialis]|uniref:S-adenosyl-L-methionine-dependent methyltransferase n=1 Tax=Polarella glacialis TaxID=89957 RepID=A0A813K4N5_POLGL|nr:unnamed protein product [Polarella glacialis]
MLPLPTLRCLASRAPAIAPLRRSFAAGKVALTPRQRARTLPAALWRSLHLTQASHDGAPKALCSDRLAIDLTAALLPDHEVVALLSGSEGGIQEAEVAGIHGAFLDRIVLDAVGKRLRQVVIIGAGMDTRAYRLELPPQMRIVEVEEAEVSEAKLAVLSAAGHHTRCRLVSAAVPPAVLSCVPGQAQAAEVQAGLRAALQANVDLNKPCLLILGEGLLNGVWAGVEEAVLTELAEVAAEGSRLVAPIHASDTVTASAAAVRLKMALGAAGWTRVDVVGEKSLSRIFFRAPPDDEAVLIVGERGQGQAPGRPSPSREPAAGGGGGPREVSF